MKILLIDPPYSVFTGYATRYFPVGLCYIGAVLKKEGHDVIIYQADREENLGGDINFSEEYKRLENYLYHINCGKHTIWEKIESVIKKYDPEVIGITSMTMTFGSVVKTAKVCKKTKPEVKVIVGGAHTTDWPKMCFETPEIDICISGEGESAIINIVRMMGSGNCDLSAIQGVSYRNNNNILLTKQNTYISNLDEYPFPARELLLNQNSYTSEDMGVIMTSRGCPYRCGFCSHPPKVRYRNLDNVMAEMKEVVLKFGTKQFAIKDDSFTVSRKRTIEFCKKLQEENLNVNWDCTTRVNLIDENLLGIMMQAGCNTIKVGIETGSERILKEVNKGVTFDQMKNTARMFNKFGIFWSAYFMYGLPTETKDDMLKTLAFMKELNPPYAGLGLYAPMPNTTLWNQGVMLELINPNIGIEHFFNTNPKDYFFKDHKKRVLNMDYDEFLETSDYLMNEFNKHNTGWHRIWQRGWSRKNAYIKDPKLFISDIRKAINWVRH